MEPDAIKDGESLEAWLQDRPPEDAMAIAHRTALRVHSLWSGAMDSEWARKADLTALPVLRLYLTSGVARKYPTPEVKAASTAAGAASASATADRAASSASTAAAEIWEQIRIDAAALLAGLDLSQRPLWSDTPPDWFTVADRNARAIWAKAPEPWHFWLRWWDGVLSGQQLDWELQKAVALIAEEEWRAGPERVAKRIAEIEARLALANTDNAETIEANPETGKLRLVPTSRLPDDIATYARRKISRALDLFGDTASNQYTAISPDLGVLRAAIDDAANMPVELLDACASTSRRVAQRAAQGECPSPEQDPMLRDFLTRIREAGADILAHDPATQQVLERRNAILGNAALIEGRATLLAGIEAVVPNTEGRLAITLVLDATNATDPATDTDDRKASSYRLVGRLIRIAKWVAVGTAGIGGAVVGTKEVLEAIPIIQASPIFQEAVKIAMRYLGF